MFPFLLKCVLCTVQIRLQHSWINNPPPATLELFKHFACNTSDTILIQLF